MKLTARMPQWAPIVLLTCAVVLGGGVWNVGDVVLGLLGLLILAGAWFGQVTGQAPRWRAVEWGVVGMFVLLALLQSIPLPSSLWAALPGRARVASDLMVAGVDGNLRWFSLDVAGMFRSLAALIPAIAMLVSIRGGSERQVARLCAWLVGLACLSVLLGIVQVAGGPESPFRLHDFHNRTGALGFFAYRNLQATHLLMTLPVAVALLLNAYSPAREAHAPFFGRALVMLALPLLLLGVALTFSRAGLILGVLTLCGCFALYWTWQGRERQRIALLFLLAAVGIGIALIGWFALPGLLGRLDENPLYDGRWSLHARVLDVAQTYQPAGAGLGSFEQVFQAAPPNVALLGAYVNHAHNEWLQVWLELGWLSIPLALAVLGVLGRAAWRAWRRPWPVDGLSGIILARAASISVLIALIHSYFDYPLRTGSNLVVFFLMAGLMVRAGFADTAPAAQELSDSTTEEPGATIA